jgi:hypothetical protein
MLVRITDTNLGNTLQFTSFKDMHHAKARVQSK